MPLIMAPAIFPFICKTPLPNTPQEAAVVLPGLAGPGTLEVPFLGSTTLPGLFLTEKVGFTCNEDPI